MQANPLKGEALITYLDDHLLITFNMNAMRLAAKSLKLELTEFLNVAVTDPQEWAIQLVTGAVKDALYASGRIEDAEKVHPEVIAAASERMQPEEINLIKDALSNSQLLGKLTALAEKETKKAQTKS